MNHFLFTSFAYSSELRQSIIRFPSFHSSIETLIATGLFLRKLPQRCWRSVDINGRFADKVVGE